MIARLPRIIVRPFTPYLKSHAPSRTIVSTSTARGVSRLYDGIPAFIYGTAWKKDRTKELVKEAVAVGFRRVDTAAQPRHYQEALVGEALREAFTQGLLKREELYVRIHISSLLPYSYPLSCRQNILRLQDKM
jgi:diketogulonate reductase-like aldo/keto reductase